VKAVVLVGGEGTRLRPLTSTMPKPLVPLIDRPLLAHLLARLGRFGVDEVLLSSPYLGNRFERFVEGWTEAPRIAWVTEREPLGTAGAIANAARDLDATFLVCNGDILTDLRLHDLVAAHRSAGAVATIALTPVDDARPYGLVVTIPAGRVTEFREKPAVPIPGNINAGTYVLEPGSIDSVAPGRSVSIERETFPALIASGGPVHAFVSDAYWMDVGTPEKYLRATFDVLEGRVSDLSYRAPYVDPSAVVSDGAAIGRLAVLGRLAAVEAGARIEDSIVLDGAIVESNATVRDCILGPGSRVGEGAILHSSVLGEGVIVPAGTTVTGERIGGPAAVER
jgi:mannose-1-phosphate guanylyltransferase